MFTGADWDDRSKRGEVCAVFGCGERPTIRCPDCSRHYCYLDVKNHHHPIADQEIEERTKRTEQLK